MQVVGCLTLCLNFLHGIKMKIFGELLRYVNFGAVAACRVFVCESYVV